MADGTDEPNFLDAAPPGLLDSVFTWLGQPGYAVKNVIQGFGTGDPLGGLAAAGQNLLQFSSDLTTLGMLTEPLTGYSANPWRNDTLMGLAGIEAGGHGITTRDELPAPVDVLRNLGFDTPDPELGWGKTMAINFLGDVVTDPLNLFAGAGTAAKAAKGAAAVIAGAGKAGAMQLAETAGRALAQTAKGAELLRNTGLDALLAAKHTPQAFADAPEVMARVLRQTAGREINDAVEEAWLKHLPDFVADKSVDPAIDAAHQAATLRAQAAQAAAQGLPTAPLPPHMAAPDPLALGIAADPIADPSAWRSVYRDNLAATRLAERLGVDVADPLVLQRITGDQVQRTIVQAGTDALAREGFMRQPGALYFGLPFQRELVKVMEPESVSKVWEGLKWVSPPHFGWNLFHRLGPQGMVKVLEEGAENTWRGLQSIYSKSLAGVSAALPESLPIMAQNFKNLLAGHTYSRVNDAAQALVDAGLTAESRDLGDALTRSLREYGDDVRLANFAETAGPSRIDQLAATAQTMARTDAAVAQRIAEFTRIFGDQQTAEVYAAGVAKITDEIRQVPELAQRAHHVPAILDANAKIMAPMRAELESRGIWGSWWKQGDKAGRLRTNPFYVSNQADDMIGYFLAEHQLPASKAAADYAAELASATDDVLRDSVVKFSADNYTRARKYDLAELYDKLTKVADKYNVPVPTLGAATADALSTDLTSLVIRRVVAHEKTIAKADFAKAVAQFVKVPGQIATNEAIDTYMKEQFTALAPRSSWGKILGGGEFVFGLPGSQPAPFVGSVAKTMAKIMGVPIKTIGDVKGTPVEVLQFPGVNWLFRGLLTSGPAGLKVSFYTRNLASSAFMAALDPDLGPVVAARILRAGIQVPLLSFLSRATGRKWATSDLAVMIDAIENGWDDLPGLANRTGRPINELVQLATREVVPGLKARELTQFARNNVVQANAYRLADDMGLIGDLENVKKVADEPFLEGLRRAWKGQAPSEYGRAFDVMKALVRPGARINDGVEAAGRFTTFLAYLEKGYGLEEAGRKTLERFVDYAYQSNVERWIRDLSLFARYGIGTGPRVVQDFMENPASLANQAVGSIVRNRSNVGVLPPELAGQVAIPVGKDEYGDQQYITSLGLPYEAAGNLLGAATPTGFRKAFLGGLNPLVRTAAETATGIQFWNGQPVAELTKAPALLAATGLASSYEAPSGRVVYTVPPFVNHWLLGAMPWNGFVRLFDSWLDDTGFDVRLMNSATGVKIRTVEEHQAVKRVALEYLRQAFEAGDVQRIEKFFVPKGREVPPEIRQALAAANANVKQRR